MPRRSCQTATASTPEGELKRHLASLGLDSAESYRAWCRGHGFSANLNKDWRARREELRAARREHGRAESRNTLQQRARSLGLETVEEYRAFCERHDIAPAARRPWVRIEHERAMLVEERADLATAKRARRRPEETIRALYGQKLKPADVQTPYLRRVGFLLNEVRDEPGVGRAFVDLILCSLRYPGLLGLDPVIAYLDSDSANTFVDAILALARRWHRWILPPNEWNPDSRSPRRQFASLARHLFARYPVPAFMDAAWFEGGSARARAHQDWYLHIGSGQNIRTANVPIALTKRAAYHFLLAPADLPIESALRWGQVLGLGGDEYLARAIVATRLREALPDEPFWQSVVHFLINSRMLDRHCVGPMVDYLWHRRIEQRDREFTMKGRTADALGRLVETWQREAARGRRRRPTSWEPSGIRGFVGEPYRADSGRTVRWLVRELLSARELKEEGREMRHCVASYVNSCARGHVSIWSISMEDCQAEAVRRVMTVEVDNNRRAIVQARGRCNRQPGEKRTSERLNEAPAILRTWSRQESLWLPPHLKG